MSAWVIPDIGHSEKIHADQGIQLRSIRRKSTFRDAGIQQEKSRVESHNVIGAGERHHALLLQIFRKVRAELLNVGKEHALYLSVKVVNDIAGTNGLSPVFFVLILYPRMPQPPTDLYEQRERMKVLE